MKVRPITEEERRLWASELSDSRFTIPGVIDTYNKSRFVCELEHAHGCVKAMYALPCPDILPHTYAKFARAVARVAALAKELAISHLSYVIIPCPEKRFWPDFAHSHSSSVENIHINGAFTYKSGSAVYVFREEEYPKVMLHEAIHHSYLDPSSLPSLMGTDALFRQWFNIHPETQLLVGEGVVEAFAKYYHCKFVAEETHAPFESLWKLECEWMQQQSAKVIERMKTAPWRETTNAFAYIVICWLCSAEMHGLHKLRTLLLEKRPLLEFFKEAIRTTARIRQGHAPSSSSNSMRLTVFGDY